MILMCDPPRHAFSIQFGKWPRPSGTETLKCECDGARVEVALSQDRIPPVLIAVEFIRHTFWLPFVGSRDGFSTEGFHLRHRRSNDEYSFHFWYPDKSCRETLVVPGLVIITGESARPTDFRRRPLLVGLRVDLRALAVDIDANEFEFDFGADTLK